MKCLSLLQSIKKIILLFLSSYVFFFRLMSSLQIFYTLNYYSNVANVAVNQNKHYTGLPNSNKFFFFILKIRMAVIKLPEINPLQLRIFVYYMRQNTWV